MPKTDTTKKSRRTVTVTNSDGNKVIITQTFDASVLKSQFNKWVTECKAATPEQMRIKGVKAINLLELVKKHGIENRPQAKNPVSEEDGIGSLIKEMSELVKDDKKILTKGFQKKVDEYIEHLNEMKDSDADPRNTPFTIPIFRRVNKKTAQFKKKNVKIHYGHYRTKDYNSFRNLKSKVFKNKEYAETLEAVPKSWATTSENTSKPPMWQALYAEGGGEGMLVTTGLFTVLQSAKGVGKKVVNEHVKLVLRGVPRGGLSKELYSIDDIKETILQLVGNKDNIGRGVNPNTGNIRDDQITRMISRMTFKVDDETESNRIKDVYGVKEMLEAEVKGYSLDITRGMVKNLFLLTGLCARRSRKGPVYLKGYVTPKEKKEKVEAKKKEKVEAKKDKKLKKSWAEVLVW